MLYETAGVFVAITSLFWLCFTVVVLNVKVAVYNLMRNWVYGEPSYLDIVGPEIAARPLY